VPRDLDVIVLGVGTMGAAACAELARRGRSVLGLDRFDPPHEHGSHHGATRLFRKAYFEHPDYVPLLHRAAELWEETNREAGESVYTRTGGVFAGPPEGEVVRGTLESARRHGLGVDTLTPGGACERFPWLTVPGGYSAVFDHDAGVILAERAVAHFIRAARRAGADLRTSEPAESWEPDGDGLRVRSAHGEYRARSLVVTCGAWAAPMLPSLGIRLVVTRQVAGWVRPPGWAALAGRQHPVWGVENADGTMHYGAPMMPGERGLKVALHARGAEADPQRVDRAVNERDRREILAGANRCLAGAPHELVDSRVCLYTNSPDSNFVVGRLPGAAAVFVACGFSGHGFKFAPVIGEILADLASTGRTAHPIAFLSPERIRA